MSKTQELIELLAAGKVDPLVVNFMYSRVVKDASRSLSDHLHTLGFANHEKIARELSFLDNDDVLPSIIDPANTVKDIHFPRQEKFRIADLCKAHGLMMGAEVLDYLINFKHDSNVLVGRGEALMRLLMKGTACTHGDYAADGKIYEVKFNHARLRGMRGYDTTNAANVARALDRYFGPRNWNFYKSTKTKEKTYALATAVDEDPSMAPYKACGLYVRALKEYFTKMTEAEAAELSKSLSEEFCMRKMIHKLGDYPNFAYKLCAFAMKYYANREDFDAMIVLNYRLEAMYISREFIKYSSMASMAKFIRQNIKMTPPGFGEKAAAQGSAFGISLL
jgi:hypothetical protein